MEENAKLVLDRERAREQEFKEKGERIRKILESGKDIIGKPTDDRERRQEMKMKKWEDKRER